MELNKWFVRHHNNENSLWMWLCQKTKSNQEFYRKIGFCFGMSICWNVYNVFLLLITKCTMQALIQHVYSFHLLHSISVVVCVRFSADNQHNFEKHYWELRTNQSYQNNVDNSNGNTIDEHHLLLQFMRTFMQLGDKFMWAMVSHGYRNGKIGIPYYSVGERDEKKIPCLFSCIGFVANQPTQNLHKIYAKFRI